MATGFTKDNAELNMIYLTKFFDLIRGALTAAPRMLAPVMKIPPEIRLNIYQAAPTTDAPKAKPIPR
jgi:hypothetical protein